MRRDITYLRFTPAAALRRMSVDASRLPSPPQLPFRWHAAVFTWPVWPERTIELRNHKCGAVLEQIR